MIFRDPFIPFRATKCLQFTPFAAGRMASQNGRVSGRSTMTGMPSPIGERDEPTPSGPCRRVGPGRGKTAGICGFLCAFAAFVCPARAQVEDAGLRSQLPLYQTIPAATPQEQTPSNGLPAAETLQTWTVSHGDPFADRYSALAQINRGNVG